jgi:hypothetical protein
LREIFAACYGFLTQENEEEAEMTSRTDITWADMQAAGIDTERVERIRHAQDNSLQQWEAGAPDDLTKIVFGECSEEPGWDAGTYERDDTESEWVFVGTPDFWEPADHAGMLARVASWQSQA